MPGGGATGSVTPVLVRGFDRIQNLDAPKAREVAVHRGDAGAMLLRQGREMGALIESWLDIVTSADPQQPCAAPLPVWSGQPRMTPRTVSPREMAAVA